MIGKTIANTTWLAGRLSVILLAAAPACLVSGETVPQQQSSASEAAQTAKKYVVTEGNYRNLENTYRQQFPNAFIGFCDIFLNNTPDRYGNMRVRKPEQMDDDRNEMMQFFERPVTAKQFAMVNMFGVWLRMAEARSNGYSFESKLSGGFYQRFFFTIQVPIEDMATNTNRVLGMANLCYARPDEFNSNDTAVTALKLACCDFMEDCMTSKNCREKLTAIVLELLAKEKNGQALARLQALADKHELKSNGRL